MKKIYIKSIFVFSLFLTSCGNDFLDQLPKDQLVAETAFTNYNNFRTYSYGFYDYFSGYDRSLQNAEFNADLMLNNTSKTSESNWIKQLVTIPTTSTEYSGPYSAIRRANIMLDYIETSELTQIDKDHWRSVGYFFRALAYYDLVSKYGDVLWIEHALKDNSPELTSPRTPRNEVTQNMLDNLLYAETHIKTDGDGPNTIGVDAVRALISRFGLFEGTWRKYHEIGDYEKYLRAGANSSEALIEKYPVLFSNYDLLFNSASLAGIPEVILYKQYETGQITASLTTRTRNSSGNWDLTKKAADMYLLRDGRTVFEDPAFDKKDPYKEFRNRDLRMLYTIVPPFKVKANGFSWSFDSDAKYREYIDLMQSLSDIDHKLLPTRNWQGIIVITEPHFRDYNNGQPFNVTRTGYRMWKYYNNMVFLQDKDINDAPIFRMGEIFVNYAELKYELGEFNQSIADITVNKLRDRGLVAHLKVGYEPNDPTMDPSVPATLWEIRRERAVELMGEGFRFNDLRRWKKMNYTDLPKLGMWVKNSQYGNRLDIQNGAAEGNILVYGNPIGNFPEYYYLYPIPSNEIVLTNGAVVQNSGWK